MLCSRCRLRHAGSLAQVDALWRCSLAGPDTYVGFAVNVYYFVSCHLTPNWHLFIYTAHSNLPNTPTARAPMPSTNTCSACTHCVCTTLLMANYAPLACVYAHSIQHPPVHWHYNMQVATCGCCCHCDIYKALLCQCSHLWLCIFIVLFCIYFAPIIFPVLF